MHQKRRTLGSLFAFHLAELETVPVMNQKQ
jgi:hypothetical protein